MDSGGGGTTHREAYGATNVILWFTDGTQADMYWYDDTRYRGLDNLELSALLEPMCLFIHRDDVLNVMAINNRY